MKTKFSLLTIFFIILCSISLSYASQAYVFEGSSGDWSGDLVLKNLGKDLYAIRIFAQYRQNTGSVDGKTTLIDGRLSFSPVGYPECKVIVQIQGKSAKVEQKGSDGSCGLGVGVYVSGDYKYIKFSDESALSEYQKFPKESTPVAVSREPISSKSSAQNISNNKPSNSVVVRCKGLKRAGEESIEMLTDDANVTYIIAPYQSGFVTEQQEDKNFDVLKSANGKMVAVQYEIMNGVNYVVKAELVNGNARSQSVQANSAKNNKPAENFGQYSQNTALEIVNVCPNKIELLKSLANLHELARMAYFAAKNKQLNNNGNLHKLLYFVFTYKGYATCAYDQFKCSGDKKFKEFADLLLFEGSELTNSVNIMIREYKKINDYKNAEKFEDIIRQGDLVNGIYTSHSGRLANICN
ncbi:hypothetical protein [Solidesulfovibrio alcoholivorans]|uniref:hypothetical protein n=1 Tax=Solidesulfovibrio alcoholivorans TaxID=81406 RepID=UPI0012EC08A1|nr:hypothetical protein [Solidesulfovibrio alcoholivorans]